MKRRAVLRWTGAGIAAGTAGCLGGLTGEKTPSPPPDNVATETLLPEAPQGWSRKKTYEMSTRMLDIEEGSKADYETPAGDVYEAEVLRWHSKSEATKQSEKRYESWKTSLVKGAYSFGADGTDGELARELLANSPAVKREQLEDQG